MESVQQEKTELELRVKQLTDEKKILTSDLGNYVYIHTVCLFLVLLILFIITS